MAFVDYIVCRCRSQKPIEGFRDVVPADVRPSLAPFTAYGEKAVARACDPVGLEGRGKSHEHHGKTVE